MKNIVFKTNVDGVSHSFKYDKLISIEHTAFNTGLYAVNFLFESDKGNEIYSVGGIIVSDFVVFLRDFYGDLNGSKSDSVVVIDEVTKNHVSNKVGVTALSVTTIASPVLLNGNLNLAVDENGATLSQPYNVTAGDITAVSNLISDGDVTAGGDITFGGSLVDNSTTLPTVATNGAGETVSISGKDSTGVVTFTTTAAAGSNVTVSYGTSSTNTRIPVVCMVGPLDAYLLSYDNNGFIVRVGASGVGVGNQFTYITKDHA